MSTIVKSDLCEGCGDCVETCPCGAIEMKDSKAVIDSDTCADCGACVDTCPTHAIETQ